MGEPGRRKAARHSGDPDRIVLELCSETGVDLAPEADEEDEASDGESDPFVRAEARALAVVRRYLAEVAPDLCPYLDDGPPERAQGPP